MNYTKKEIAIINKYRDLLKELEPLEKKKELISTEIIKKERKFMRELRRKIGDFPPKVECKHWIPEEIPSPDGSGVCSLEPEGYDCYYSDPKCDAFIPRNEDALLKGLKRKKEYIYFGEGASEEIKKIMKNMDESGEG